MQRSSSDCPPCVPLPSRKPLRQNRMLRSTTGNETRSKRPASDPYDRGTLSILCACDGYRRTCSLCHDHRNANRISALPTAAGPASSFLGGVLAVLLPSF